MVPGHNRRGIAGGIEGTMKRAITEREQEAYQLRHHDFCGLTVKETAEKMGVTRFQVAHLLHSMKKKAPQLFPILTKQQVRTFELWLRGDTIEDIAIEMGVMDKTVENVMLTVKEKMGTRFPPHNTILSYTDSMEGNVKEKF